MQSKKQFQNLLFHTISRAATAALAMAIVFALTVVLTQSAQAQTFKVLHTFTGGADGGEPNAGLTMDKAGNLYGTAYYGGSYGNGTVFELSHRGSGWVFTPLYSFQGLPDGSAPGALVFGPGGSLYGPTYWGGLQSCWYGMNTCGTVFNLRPAASACKTALCPWTETVLYRFSSDYSSNPLALTFDPAGNMYISTAGQREAPAILELEPSNGGWQQTNGCTIWDSDGDPGSGVILDATGNLYGVVLSGGAYGLGYVYQLNMSGGCSWNILYSFQGGSDGAGPAGALIFDNVGNLYGTTSGGGGTVFKLTPSGANWTYSLIYSLTGNSGPVANLTMDAAGNLYGTTFGGGAHAAGSVFKLTPSGGGWTYTDLHDFTGGSDGEAVDSNVTLDANGNLYGTAAWGGDTSGDCHGLVGCGTVWEITFP